MSQLLTTRQVAELLNINEKAVYGLISERGLPATKVTGKWLYPRSLVEQWIEGNTLNSPPRVDGHLISDAILILTGSNDILLEKVIALFNKTHPDNMAVFGNVGSVGGLHALRRNLCHIASSHLLQSDEHEYNFEFAGQELDHMPAVVNFCKREQGLLVARGNPKNIRCVADLGREGIRMVNRAMGTGTRQLLDRELAKARISGDKIKGYHHSVPRHLDVGVEILAKRADAGLGIRAVAGLLHLDFVPLRWERYDLMIFKERFFDVKVQRFLSLLHTTDFYALASLLEGYDTTLSGRMLFQKAEIEEI